VAVHLSNSADADRNPARNRFAAAVNDT
jgi:hypothetical protein